MYLYITNTCRLLLIDAGERAPQASFACRVLFFFTLLPHILATEKAHPGDGRQGDGAMQEHIRERVLTLSDYIIESGATVRQTATKYGISKSTVHIEVIIGNASFG